MGPNIMRRRRYFSCVDDFSLLQPQSTIMASTGPTVVIGGMADNSSASSSLMTFITSGDIMSSRYILIAGATVAFVLLLGLVSPRLDAQEPPLLKPSIPLIGHMIGLMKHQSQYHVLLQ